MSYFTETFENILEFKGEAELAYAKRREYESDTHKHSEGSKSYRNGRSELNNNHHDSNMSGLNKDNYAMKTKTNKALAQARHHELDNRKDPVSHSISKHNRTNESFDPVYNDLVNMGIIN